MKIVRIAKIKFLGAIKKLLYHWKLFLTSLLNIWTVLFRFKIRPNEIFLTHPSCPLIFLRSSFSQYLVGFKLYSQKVRKFSNFEKVLPPSDSASKMGLICKSISSNRKVAFKIQMNKQLYLWVFDELLISAEFQTKPLATLFDFICLDLILIPE